MKTRKIALFMVLLMSAAFFLFSVVLGSYGANSWALPAFLAVIAIILIVGVPSLVRAQRAQR